MTVSVRHEATPRNSRAVPDGFAPIDQFLTNPTSHRGRGQTVPGATLSLHHRNKHGKKSFTGVYLALGCPDTAAQRWGPGHQVTMFFDIPGNRIFIRSADPSEVSYRLSGKPGAQLAIKTGWHMYDETVKLWLSQACINGSTRYETTHTPSGVIVHLNRPL